ncbi:transmembrane protein 158 [Protopterus annectens]|uniref:transmembrane protein 158 n=1 Tax=Protopterus annectens TaxID=7888 RepID=UPI001CFA7F14|nr:transmembrane protein 158 [Protopterus annectens]
MLNFPYLLLAVLATATTTSSPSWTHQEGWGGGEDLLLPPINSSSRSLASLELDLHFSKRSSDAGDADLEDVQEALPSQASPSCNISVQKLLSTSLVVRWNRQLGFQCDVFVFTINNYGRAFFSAAFNRVLSPVVIEHLGVSGAQQEFRLCVGCSWGRARRPASSNSAYLQQRSSFSSSPAAPAFPPQGELLNFCCLDFGLDELKGDQSWRLNRKPIESTLVACFMTLVIIVWSVAALIWPVPIIAGFLPNGMEQRRGGAPPTASR